ncbi:glycerol-3-phosphate responsive antiterminator [Moorella sp. Hama-1]|uniref:glycerol-3-phosphate responsive antiterminator n=1 Tax=Moorella sp. Hama-1 TaxID=2138101 RepID=UPI00137AA0C7|nr:glycerol-3-phosphate responsive antiterminator [Moorella sp. Hama-1]BCV22919.1 glycerol uptake operon antiterminator regulatory protein [Moorella sp. Hama-1]
MLISKKVFATLKQYPVIPALWGEQALNSLLDIPAAVISLQFGSIIDLASICAKLHEDYKAVVFIHVELIRGIGSDNYAVEYVKQCGGDGIISTKPSLIEAAHSVGILSILRTFIEDSRSLKRAMDITRKTAPDALDILPGPVIPEIIPDLRSKLSQPIIASGLIKRKEQVQKLLTAGCLAISTSHNELWALNKGFKNKFE